MQRRARSRGSTACVSERRANAKSAPRAAAAAALSGSETPVGIRYGYSAGLSFDDGLAKPGGS
jgi:hypothetical protein